MMFTSATVGLCLIWSGLLDGHAGWAVAIIVANVLDFLFSGRS